MNHEHGPEEDGEIPGIVPANDADPAENAPRLLPIEDSLDLHAFRPAEILDAVRSYLEEARNHGYSEVRLIHGKGTGFQRERVRSLLASHPLVEGFVDAPAERGHWGATVVRLVKQDPED